MNQLSNGSNGMRHDMDGVFLYNDHTVSNVLEFDPNWVEREGPCKDLPIHVGEWIKQNLKSTETVVGVRWVNFHPYPFMLRCFDNSFHASFKLPDKRLMDVRPGSIEISRYPPSRELLTRYNQFTTAEGTTWKAWFETKRRYDYNYHDCPHILEVTLSLIDNMLYEITKVPNRRVASTLQSLASIARSDQAVTPTPGPIPVHLAELFTTRQTYLGDIVTPDEVRNYYHFLSKRYYFSEVGIPYRSEVADPVLYDVFLDVLLVFLQGKELETDPFTVYKKKKQSE